MSNCQVYAWKNINDEMPLKIPFKSIPDAVNYLSRNLTNSIAEIMDSSGQFYNRNGTVIRDVKTLPSLDTIINNAANHSKNEIKKNINRTNNLEH